MESKLIYKFASKMQPEYFCPYCKNSLHYLWNGKILFGLALDKWVHCSKCKIHFKIGINGFREYELDLSNIKLAKGESKDV